MHHSNPADHAQHDLDLIAASIDDDLSDAQRAAAEAVVTGCPSCADLRRDLVALAISTRALPRTAAAPRDFRLDPAQAARLRRGGLLRRVLRPFVAPGSAVRPLAAACTTIGLAGLLVANILPSLFGGPASVTLESGGGLGALPAASSAPAEVPRAGQPAATGGSGNELQGAQSSPGTNDQFGAKTDSNASTPPDRLSNDRGAATTGGRNGTAGDDVVMTSQVNPILVGSLVLLAIGLGLFGLRFAARRVR